LQSLPAHDLPLAKTTSFDTLLAAMPDSPAHSSPPPQPTLFAVKTTRPSSTETTTEPDLFSISINRPSGYESWQRQQQEQKKAFEKQWGIPLGCRVRLQLTTHGRPIEGIIRLANDDAHAASASPKERFLRIQSTTFSPREVESLCRI
jgi:hypothetical protein